MSVNYHSGNFRNKLFDRMMSLNEYLDVTLSVGRRTIHAHCCILAAGSSYFHTILKESIAGNKKPTLVFTDIKYEHLQKIVEYLYTGEIKVQSTEIEEFLSIAKKLKIIGLYEQTESDKLSDSVSNISAPSLSVVYELDSNQNELQNVGQMGANGRNQSQNPIENQINMRTMASTSTQAIFPMASTSNPILSRNFPRSEPNLENLKRNVVQRSVSFLNRSQATVKTVIREKSAKQPSNQSNPGSPMTNRNGRSNQSKAVPRTGRGDIDSEGDNGSGEHRCPRILPCGKTFETVQELVRHMKFKCGKAKEFECAHCKKMFYLRFGLIRHLQICTKRLINPTDNPNIPTAV